MNDKPLHVLSVGKAFTLLNCLKHSGQPLSLKELSERTGFPKSTIHSLLATMREFRAIDQDHDGRYRLGANLFELGCLVEQQWDVSKIAQPYLQSISTKTNEAVSVGVLDENSVLILNSVSAANPMRFTLDVGSRLPIHASAMGKAILAYMDEHDAEALLRHNSLTSFTPHTIVDIQAMRHEIKRIRAAGFAIENGELRVGIRAVAAPIFDYSGKAKYSIAVTGMFRKITDEVVLESEKLVIHVAAEISKRLS